MKTPITTLAAASLSVLLSTNALAADQAEDLRNLRDTTVNLLNLLVQQGVITKDKADALIRQSQQQAQQQAQQAQQAQQDAQLKATAAGNAATNAAGANTAPPAAQAAAVAPASAPAPTAAPSQPGPAPAATATAGTPPPGPAPANTASATTAPAAPQSAAPAAQAATPSEPQGTIHVQYVPQFVKDQIRDELRQEVLDQAHNEQWGDPGAMPDWLGRLSWSGDLRLRGETDLFPSQGNGLPNTSPAQLLLINGYILSNTTETRNRLRLRARLGMQARILDNLTAGIRIASGATGGGSNPVSENVTLGNYDSRASIGLDRAYVRYQPFQWMTVTGGRFGNPFFAPTDLVWSDTFSPEGIVTKFTHDFTNRLDGILVAAAIPIQLQDNEPSNLGSNPESKWLFAYQTGVDWQFRDDEDWKLAAALYDYRHVEGIADPSSQRLSTLYDWSSPGFRQKGNQVFDIHFAYDDPNSLYPNNAVWGLISKFRVFNLSTSLDFADFHPVHVILDGDYAKNLAFHQDEIENRVGSAIISPSQLINRTVGYQVKLTVGSQKVHNQGDWQTFVGFRNVERDAVLDAFTDTDFHLGGTDARGYFLGARYGVAKETYVGLRWLAADQIDSAPLAIDVFQLDFNTSF